MYQMHSMDQMPDIQKMPDIDQKRPPFNVNDTKMIAKDETPFSEQKSPHIDRKLY